MSRCTVIPVHFSLKKKKLFLLPQELLEDRQGQCTNLYAIYTLIKLPIIINVITMDLT
jgi:hypothetical protein